MHERLVEIALLEGTVASIIDSIVHLNSSSERSPIQHISF